MSLGTVPDGGLTHPVLRARFMLTRVYMWTGMIFMVLSWIVLMIASSELGKGGILHPYVLSSVHFFVVGTVLMTIQGAIMQITPVVFQGTLYSIPLGYAQYALLLLGSIGLGGSFFVYWLPGLVISGLLVLLSILILFWNIGKSMRSLKKRADALRVMIIGLFLLWTLVLGIFFVSGWGPSPTPNFLWNHLESGLVGTFTTLILMLTPRLMNFFISSHYKSTQGMRTTSEGLLYGGLLLLIVGPLIVKSLPLSASHAFPILDALPIWAGWLLYWIGYGLILFRLIQHIRMRRRKEMEWIFHWIIGGLIGGWILLFFWAMSSALMTAGFSRYPEGWPGALLLVVLFGYIQWTVAAYMAKIMPFLRWMSRFDPTINPAIRQKPRRNPPNMRTVMPRGLTRTALLAFFAGSLLLGAGMLRTLEAWTFLGSIIGALGALLYMLSMVIMYRRTMMA